jgi:hypothetical protein
MKVEELEELAGVMVEAEDYQVFLTLAIHFLMQY